MKDSFFPILFLLSVFCWSFAWSASSTENGKTLQIDDSLVCEYKAMGFQDERVIHLSNGFPVRRGTYFEVFAKLKSLESTPAALWKLRTWVNQTKTNTVLVLPNENSESIDVLLKLGLIFKHAPRGVDNKPRTEIIRDWKKEYEDKIEHKYRRPLPDDPKDFKIFVSDHVLEIVRDTVRFNQNRTAVVTDPRMEQGTLSYNAKPKLCTRPELIEYYKKLEQFIVYVQTTFKKSGINILGDEKFRTLDSHHNQIDMNGAFVLELNVKVARYVITFWTPLGIVSFYKDLDSTAAELENALKEITIDMGLKLIISAQNQTLLTPIGPVYAVTKDPITGQAIPELPSRSTSAILPVYAEKVFKEIMENVKTQ